MGKLTFTSIAQIRAYAQARFPTDVAFSRMTATQKAYANVYGMTILNPTPTLAQLKERLLAGCKTAQSATREKIYKFIAERIDSTDDPKTTLAAVIQELAHILEQLKALQPLPPDDTPMEDSEHEKWLARHTEIGMLRDQARHLALWLVPDSVKTILAKIDERCIALYAEGLTEEENALYNAAKADDNRVSRTGLTYRQFLESVEGNEQYSHWLDHASEPRAEEY